MWGPLTNGPLAESCKYVSVGEWGVVEMESMRFRVTVFVACALPVSMLLGFELGRRSADPGTVAVVDPYPVYVGEGLAGQDISDACAWARSEIREPEARCWLDSGWLHVER